MLLSLLFLKIIILVLQFNYMELRLQSIITISSRNMSQPPLLAVRCNHPQNADLPRYYSKREKKPFPIPIVELRRNARERAKNRAGQPRLPPPPPKRGLVVQKLIPVAYGVLNARTTLINNLKKLLKVVPVQACK